MNHGMPKEDDAAIKVSVALPWDLTEERLHRLEDVPRTQDGALFPSDIDEDFHFLRENNTDDGYQRVFLATVLLHQRTGRSFEDCFHQAIVWEHG